MYISAILVTKPPRKVVIPIQWFYSLDLAQIFNVGASKTKLHKVFFCEDIDKDPNFRLEVKEVYVDSPACYRAQVKHAFSTFEAAENHMKKARPVLAAVYNENLVRYDWHAPEPAEDSCNQIVHVKLEREVGRLQQEIAELKRQMAVADLDQDELEDIQETLMDVDDEIESILNSGDDVNNDSFAGAGADAMANADGLASDADSTADDNFIGDGLQIEQSFDGNGITNDADESHSFDSAVSTTTATQQQTVSQITTSAYDSVAGYMTFALDGKGDRYFPSVDVSISGAIYGLMQFYNEQQTTTSNGELFDLKFTNLLMKAIFGAARMVEMDPENIDMDDPKMIFARDLFAIRVDGNVDRLVFFEMHASKCIEQIKQKVFISQVRRR